MGSRAVGTMEEPLAFPSLPLPPPRPHLLELPLEIFEPIYLQLDYPSLRALSLTHPSLRAFLKDKLPHKRIQFYKESHRVHRGGYFPSDWLGEFLCWECWQMQPISCHIQHKWTSGAYESIPYGVCVECQQKKNNGQSQLTDRERRMLEFKDQCSKCSSTYDIRYVTLWRRCPKCSARIILEWLLDLLLGGLSVVLLIIAATQWTDDASRGAEGLMWVLVLVSMLHSLQRFMLAVAHICDRLRSKL